ncbi:MAG TPA: META domain-containing protein [Dongiaceae bacterium]|nr:META domain-containing protein [Dongiaceae bacterium]
MLSRAASLRAIGGRLLVPAFLLLAGCSTLQSMTGESKPDQRGLLLGQLWIADQIAGQPLVPDTRVTLSMYGDGRLVGRTGCNTYTGRFKTEAGALQVTALDVGHETCAAEAAAQEQTFLGTLGSAASYEVQADNIQPGGLLVVTTADGRTLRFHRDANAAVQRLDYECEDGTVLAVIFDWNGGSATVSENGAIAATLARSPVPTGFRFEKAPKVLTGAGTEAQWSNGVDASAAPVACQVMG